MEVLGRSRREVGLIKKRESQSWKNKLQFLNRLERNGSKNDWGWKENALMNRINVIFETQMTAENKSYVLATFRVSDDRAT